MPVSPFISSESRVSQSAGRGAEYLSEAAENIPQEIPVIRTSRNSSDATGNSSDATGNSSDATGNSSDATGNSGDATGNFSNATGNVITNDGIAITK